MHLFKIRTDSSSASGASQKSLTLKHQKVTLANANPGFSQVLVEYFFPTTFLVLPYMTLVMLEPALKALLFITEIRFCPTLKQATSK